MARAWWQGGRRMRGESEGEGMGRGIHHEMRRTECWVQFGIVWDLSMSFDNMLTQARSSYRYSHFLEKVLYASWNIWKQRNGCIFDNIAPFVPSWMAFFRNDLSLLVHRLSLDERPAFVNWLNQLLNIRDMLQRIKVNLHEGANCVRCNNIMLEDVIHLFFSCTFAQQCWQCLGLYSDPSMEFMNMI
uniref:Reverse transcriptase zinc-binding domain-containing protein n=1 Tax=Oryza meridionalis TaxID=40149 RepID=A0A0E0C255_9ORYZ